MSRKAIVITVILLILMTACCAAGKMRGILVYVNGQPVRAQAIERDGVTYLPVRAISETLGMTVKWDAASQAVYLQGGETGAPVEVYEPQSANQAAQSTQDSKETVHVTKSGKKYHRAGCRSLSRSDIPIARKDAEAKGYSPCSNCSP